MAFRLPESFFVSGLTFQASRYPVFELRPESTVEFADLPAANLARVADGGMIYDSMKRRTA